MSQSKSKTLYMSKSKEGFTEEQARHQLEALITKSIGQTLERFGWVGRVIAIKQEGINTHADVVFKKVLKRERENSDEVFTKNWIDLFGRLVQYTNNYGWAFTDENKLETELSIVCPSQDFNVILPAEIQPHFKHIFDRDAQIRIIYQSIQNAVRSSFEQRSHCVLYGEPACGKSAILLAFKDMLGDENFINLDATATTKAGIENYILDTDKVPPFIILEEAEKCNPANLPWLLGVLDQRGEINKTNARRGRNRREAKCLCLATVNNLQEFKTMMSGALASRFQHKLYCPRPTEEILRQIIVREITARNGDPAWANPAMEYAIKVEKTNDPRRIISLLDGGERLLTGEYQRDLLSIREAMRRDNVEEF